MNQVGCHRQEQDAHDQRASKSEPAPDMALLGMELICRYRDENKKTQLCHTLNGSALALPRIVAALLENNQTPEGIRIPKALVPYTGFDMIK